MLYTDFDLKTHGFAGHMAEPDSGRTDQAVIVIMGGEKSLFPGIKIAERFADFGITGLAVSLFGAEGLPNAPDRIPIEVFSPAIKYLREVKGMKSISIYGMSMGTIFAALAAKHIGGIDNLILCSPAHVSFEGCQADKQHMTGHSVATYNEKEIPFVKQDFSSGKMLKYVYDEKANRKVTKMWVAYRNAYENKQLESAADLHLEKTGARILLIAGEGDEAWPSDYSARYMKNRLDECKYEKDYKLLLYPYASHLIGVMPNRDRNKWLYRAVPLIGLMYRSFHEHKKECLTALKQSEKEVMDWILQG